MQAPSLSAWDADQAFEACQPSAVLPAFRSTVERFRLRYGTEHVAVAAGKRLRFKIGRVGFGGGWWNFSVDQLASVLVGGLLISVVCYGDVTFKLHGMVIGGIISKVALSFLLGHEESLAIRSPQLLAAHVFAFANFL